MKHALSRGFIPLLLVVVIAVAGVAGGTFYLSKQKSKKNKLPMGVTATASTLDDVLAFGHDMKCAFTNAQGSGTLYVSADGHMRADSVSNSQSAAVIESHTLVSGDGSTYVWSGNQGFKVDSKGVTAPAAGASAQAAADVHYTCEEWKADDATFAVPSAVTFIK